MIDRTFPFAAELWPTRSQLVGNVPPGLMRRLGIGLQEGLPDRGGDHGVLAFRHVRQGMRIQCTRQRCQPAPNTRRIAALSPSWASEMTSLTPRKPRRAKLLRNVDQNVSASEGPMCSPTISRLPSVLAATAIIAATDTMRPPSRCFR